MLFRKKLKVSNKHGLHARPASKIVNIVNKFKANLFLTRLDGNGKRADCKSVLQMLLLGANKDTELELIAEGVEAYEAIEEVSSYFNRNFDEVV
jgi:phosphotransferase system HPr (HPr) family protein